MSVKIVPKRPRHRPPANRLVVALAYDGLCTFEFGVAVEIFGLARPEMGEAWYRFRVAAIALDADAARGAQRSGLDGGDPEAIPSLSHLRSVEAEDLDRHPELEGAEPVVGERHHQAVARRAGSWLMLWHDLHAHWHSCHLSPIMPLASNA